MFRQSGRVVVLIFGLLLVAVVFPSAVDFYTDWLWFGETGYQGTYLRMLGAQSTVGAVALGFAFAVLAANVRVALGQLRPRQLILATRDGPVSLSVDRQKVQPLAMLGAAIVAVLFALYASGHWREWLFFLNGQPFGEPDPILNRDVGFYVFTLPFLERLQGFLLALVVASMVASIATYVVAGVLDVNLLAGRRLLAPVKRHLTLLATLLLLVLAFGAWLDIPRLLTGQSGIIHGAGAVDVAVRIPTLRVLTFAALIGAGLALYQSASHSWWPLLTAVALYVGVNITGSVAGTIMQRFIVAPNEQVRETPYIQHNIAATRKAFALDRVEEREVSGDQQLTRADIESNRATLGNVRLWDHQPLLQTFSQIQEIRTYYDFVSVHNDRYLIDGQYRQIMVSARELNPDSLPNRNWINEHLTFTHGYGVTLGPVNQVAPEGLPVLFIKDIPPQSSVDLKVDEPSIYYGQLANDHVFVRTKAREFHYPRGEDNVYTTYEGTGGVPVSSFMRRLLFSIRFRSFKVLLSEDITSESRVMFYRRIQERVSRIAPFLQYDSDPYLVISNGRLVWVQDAYTTSSRYPYGSPAANGINYIRNAVKVTIDAFHGTVAFHLLDDTDPIALTLQRIFPDLFRPMSDMPEDMRTRLRYPEGIFALQAAMYATYHMTNPAVFYNKEDLWEVPAIDAEPRAQLMQPYYTIMRLPGETNPEFIQMLPFTPARKDNLASWMVARSDGAHYGRMLIFQFPKQKVVFGPRQIVARINQDQAISPQITLWNQQGSEVLMGTLLVIPVEESLLYVRPLYLRAAGGRIPELKRVIVAHQNQIVMEETLEAALDRLFHDGGARPAGAAPSAESPDLESRRTPTLPGAPGSSPAVAPGSPASELSVRALEHYQRAIQAQREGNWALYGDEIKRLGDVLSQMERGGNRAR